MVMATNTKSNFGSRGWSTIIFCMLMYYNFAAWTADGLNIFTRAYSNLHGWDAGTLLSYSTPASWIGVLGALVFGQTIVKRGPLFVAIFGLIAQGIVCIWFGNIQTEFEYAIAISLLNFFATGFGFIVPGTIINNWFPRKKGLALGWATMGMGFCTATFVALVSFLYSNFGVSMSMTIIGLLMIVAGVVTYFWIKDTPEMAGVFPDNDPTCQEDLEEVIKKMEAYKSPFTVSKLLKDKDMWLIATGYGCIWLVTIGIVSQYVVRLIAVGYDETFALQMLSLVAIFCLLGSYLWGWLDTKLGTKKASMIYVVSYVLTLALLLMRGNLLITLLTSVAVGSGLAGIKSYITSMTSGVFGRYDFAAANCVITPIANSIRALPFLIMGLSMKYTGELDMAYYVFIGVDILGFILISRITTECKGALNLDGYDPEKVSENGCNVNLSNLKIGNHRRI